MSRRHGLGRPSPAMLVALLALFIAMCGTSYAAIKITGKNVKNSSLTSADIKNKSLQRKDFKSSQIPAGKRGAQGPQGVPGVQTVGAIKSAEVSVAPSDVEGATVSCPAGSTPVGTGFNASIANVGFVQRFGQSVGMAVYNDTSITIEAEVQAICASGATPVAARSSANGGRAGYQQALAAFKRRVEGR